MAGVSGAARACPGPTAVAGSVGGQGHLRFPALPLDELLRRALQAHGDPREVWRDDDAPCFGARIDDRSLTPGAHARIGGTTLERWLAAHIRR